MTVVEIATSTANGHERAGLRAWIAVAAGSLAAAMATLDASIVLSSLPQIQGQIGATLSEGTWIMTGYLAAEIVVIPMCGWLVRFLGLRNMVIGGALLFVLSSVLCALSTNLTEMIVFRVAQGLTGALLVPSAHTIILTVLPRSQQAKGFALFSTGAMITPSLGPVLGGWITDHLGWEYLFLLNVPLGLILVAMLLASLDHAPVRREELRTCDWAGLLSLAVALGGLTIVLEEGQREAWFDSTLITRLSLMSGVAFAVLLYAELTHKNPVIRLSLLTEGSFAASLIISFAFGAVLYFAVYIAPVFLGTVAGYTAQQIGFSTLTLNGASMVLMPMTPMIQNRLGIRPTIALGLAIMAVSCLMNTDLTGDTGGGELFWPLVLRGAGQPLVFLPLTQIATAEISPDKAADAAGLFNMTRNLGGSVGLSLTAVLLDRRSIFHAQMLSEHLSRNSLVLQDRLRDLGAAMGAAGADVVHGQARALAEIERQIQRQGLIMAYSDTLWLFGIGLSLCIATVLLLKRPAGAAAALH